MLFKEMLDADFKIIISKIMGMGINKEWIGKNIDLNLFEEILKASKKYKFSPIFEGGEAESLVLYMPFFENEIKILNYSIKSEDEYTHSLIINKTN
jgi:diphthamide synthase (EF-2-diphthine--ammonia ligase)